MNINRHQLPFSEIEQYIERITEAEDKYRLYMELKVYWKAVEVAHKLKDRGKLNDVRLLSCFTSFLSVDFVF